jgi:hypothetical protein
VNHLFEKYKPRLQVLAEKPLLKPYILALATRWEQNNEPMPSTQPSLSEERQVFFPEHGLVLHWFSAFALLSGSFSKTMDTTEDDYFNGDSDDEFIGPTPPPTTTLVTSPSGAQKRKRPGDPEAVETTPPAKVSKTATGERPLSGGVLGLDYDDGSDSDSSEASPLTPARDRGLRPSAPIQNESTNSIDNKEASGSNPPSSPGTRIRLKLNSPSAPAGQDLDEIANRMAKKRKQETEQEDDGFGNLLSNNKPATPKPTKAEQNQIIREKPPSGVVGLGLAMKDAGKKLKINLGFGRKSVPEADKKKGDQGNQSTWGAHASNRKTCISKQYRSSKQSLVLLY